MSERRFWFYSWLLPLVWMICSLLSYNYYPGKDFHYWLLTSIAGVWWLLFTQSDNILQWWVPLVTAGCGALVMFPLGWLLDGYRLNWRVFAVLWWLPFLSVTTQLVMKNGSLSNAIVLQGSVGVYICAGINIALITTSILLLLWLWVRGAANKAKERGAAAKQAAKAEDKPE